MLQLETDLEVDIFQKRKAITCRKIIPEYPDMLFT